MFALTHLPAIKCVLVAACCVLASELRAAVVVEGTNLQFVAEADPMHNYRATVDETTASGADQTVTFFQYGNGVLSSRGGSLDAFTDWFLMQPGDVLTDAVRYTDQFPRIGSNTAVSDGTADFYLGVTTSPIDTTAPWTTFGWVRLRPAGDTLSVVASAMSYDSRGIIVGTTTLVPEPAAFAIAAWSLLGMAAIRRRLAA